VTPTTFFPESVSELEPTTVTVPSACLATESAVVEIAPI
jgi:hypothetical protein